MIEYYEMWGGPEKLPELVRLVFVGKDEVVREAVYQRVDKKQEEVSKR